MANTSSFSKFFSKVKNFLYIRSFYLSISFTYTDGSTGIYHFPVKYIKEGENVDYINFISHNLLGKNFTGINVKELENKYQSLNIPYSFSDLQDFFDFHGEKQIEYINSIVSKEHTIFGGDNSLLTIEEK